MRKFVFASTVLFLLHVSIQTVPGQDRAKHPLSENTMSSSLNVYSKWKSEAISTSNPSMIHKAVAAVTKRLDSQKAMVDLTIATSDFLPYEGSPEFVVELQPVTYKIEANGVFNSQSFRNRTQLDLPIVNQPRNSPDKLTNRTLSIFAPKPANGVEIRIRFVGGPERSSITILMPLTDQARSWAGGQVSECGIAGNNNFSGNEGFVVTKVLFGRNTTRIFEGCRTWTVTCGSCTIKVDCSNNDPHFNCVNCSYSNCTECQIT